MLSHLAGGFFVGQNISLWNTKCCAIFIRAYCQKDVVPLQWCEVLSFAWASHVSKMVLSACQTAQIAFLGYGAISFIGWK